MDGLNFEEQVAVSAVVNLSGKRTNDSPDAAGGHVTKRVRVEEPLEEAMVPLGPTLPPMVVQEEAVPEAEMKPYPFYFYNDFSKEEDPDPLTPLTPPGRVPNFPAKMHSILSRPDLADIVCWMPHGRSWRVLKPREFEIRVIPTYFEHAKFSSFIRQANGWGFRRITQGRDRNSYYHEMFLRGLPHLCKNMKRPGVSEKQASDPDHEPDLYKISEIHPVPEKAEDESILLQCTLDGGPKARMPIYSGVSYVSASSAPEITTPTMTRPTGSSESMLTPRDLETLDAFAQSLGASESQLKNLNVSGAAVATPVAIPPQPVQPAPSMFISPHQAHGQSFILPALLPGATNKVSVLGMANQLAFANSNVMAAAAAIEASSAASQFAAGFAAATAWSQQHFKQMLDSLAQPSTQP